MSGYKLSRAASEAQASWDRTRAAPVKATWTPESGRVSMHDGDNFRTNQVSVAEWSDRIARSNPLGLSATYACVNLIAGTIASLSATVFQADGDGVRREATRHPLYWLLKLDPNFDDSDYDFWEFLSASVELQGNGYARIDRNGAGRISAITPVSPIGMQVRRLSSGVVQYEWVEDGQTWLRSQESMLHIRGFGGDRLKGGSTLSMCASAFHSAMDTHSTASRMFANSALPSGVLSTETRLDGPQRAELESLLQDKFMGAMNAGRPMLLDGGLKWEALTITPEDAQLLDSRKFSGEEICRIFGVPPAMVGYGDKSSNWGTGKEADVLGFIKFTLRKRLRRMERALMKQLLTRAERQAGMTIEFNLEGLLRGDSAGRAAFYNIMVRIGLMTRNEARRLENLPPIPGGDVAMVQMQDVPLEAAVEQTGDE
ncbi:phage portal protein [Novosphingobium profundi]|uniref:phage portal protein n=1 Tax=Novosphingobium profundi TaxID=1774954 RepID=UPI001BDA216C|nr:phage portal protein [Novosphingobium profundi]